MFILHEHMVKCIFFTCSVSDNSTNSIEYNIKTAMLSFISELLTPCPPNCWSIQRFRIYLWQKFKIKRHLISLSPSQLQFYTLVVPDSRTILICYINLKIPDRESASWYIVVIVKDIFEGLEKYVVGEGEE